MVGRSWDVFQPLLFGLIGAEITIAKLNPSTVGEDYTHTHRHTLSGEAGVGNKDQHVSSIPGLGLACIAIGLLIRVLVTFGLVHFGGFSLKEKLFIAVAWLPKATVQVCVHVYQRTS